MANALGVDPGLQTHALLRLLTFIIILLRQRFHASLLLCNTKDYRSLEDISDAAPRKMSGNGMHIGCAAFTCLIAMVCISDKDL